MSICVYTQNPLVIKRGHEFEREKGGIYGRVWREEREGRNVIIKL